MSAPMIQKIGNTIPTREHHPVAFAKGLDAEKMNRTIQSRRARVPVVTVIGNEQGSRSRGQLVVQDRIP